MIVFLSRLILQNLRFRSNAIYIFRLSPTWWNSLWMWNFSHTFSVLSLLFFDYILIFFIECRIWYLRWHTYQRTSEKAWDHTKQSCTHIVLLDIVVTSLGIDHSPSLRFCKRRWPSSFFFTWIFKKNQTLLFFYNRRSLTRARCSSLSSSIDLISRKIIALTISILSRGLTSHNSHHL